MGTMRITMLRVGVLALLLGVLAGCVDTPVASAPTPSTAPSPAAPASSPAADADFARMMIPHHEQALELSALVDGRSSSPEVADLAFRIDREQVEDVGQL